MEQNCMRGRDCVCTQVAASGESLVFADLRLIDQDVAAIRYCGCETRFYPSQLPSSSSCLIADRLMRGQYTADI